MPRAAPEDIYKDEVDFTTLALRYPDFAKRLKPNRQLDFTDPESVRQLTLALLHLNHNLTLTLPPDRLCPPVPNRFNYIIYLQRLLDSTSSSLRDTFDASRQVIGLDIGCGASCIYPLLACRQRESWKMLATEIDDTSRTIAKQNIDQNDLGSRIKIIDIDATSKVLIPVKQLERFHRIDFLMTNPPFYASEKQMLDSAKAKARPPYSSCTGAPVEMIWPYHPPSSGIKPKSENNASNTDPNEEAEGGEVAFVTQLLRESSSPELRSKIQWSTAMLGHLSSLAVIVSRLKEHGCTNYAVWEFVQGSKTRRWAVAWSWRGLRPSVEVARGPEVLEKKLLPFPSETDFEVEIGSGARALEDFGHKIDEVISELEDEDDEDGMQWQWKEKQMIGLGMSKMGDCWSRKARRKKQGKSRGRDEVMKDATAEEEADGKQREHEPALVFKISVRYKNVPGRGNARADVAKTSAAVIHVRWLQGQDSVLFESFCGWLKRKVTI